MLELHIASVDASNGNIPVSWRLSKDLIAYLEEKDVKDPAIVICVVPQKYSGDHTDRNREYRKVVRLKDLMTYIELPFAGTNKLMATVDEHYSFKQAKSEYMSLNRAETGYSKQFLDYNKEDYYHQNDICNAAPITLEVPDAIFAKEPPKWEKAWVNWFSPKKAANQCEFRRKRLFAYTIQPIIFLMGYALQIVVSMLALLVGAKGFTTQPLLHPLTYNFDDKTIDLFRDGSYFIGNGITYWDKVKHVVFMPIVMLMVSTLLFFNNKASDVSFIILNGLLGSILLNGALIYYSNRKKQFERSAIPWFQDEEARSLLLCTGENEPLTISQLPSRHKTLGIRFQALKAQVCRPFSQ